MGTNQTEEEDQFVNIEECAPTESLDQLSITKQSIDEVVSFSLCSLCAIKLQYLYPEPYHE